MVGNSDVRAEARTLRPTKRLDEQAEARTLPAGYLNVRAEARTLHPTKRSNVWENGDAEEPTACSAEWTYSGPAGRFDIAAQYFDLQGGVARFTLDVNGRAVASWAADAKLPTNRPHGDNSTRSTACGVELKPGDTIRIEGTPDGSDPAALDYIEILRDWPACSD